MAIYFLGVLVSIKDFFLKVKGVLDFIKVLKMVQEVFKVFIFKITEVSFFLIFVLNVLFKKEGIEKKIVVVVLIELLALIINKNEVLEISINKKLLFKGALVFKVWPINGNVSSDVVLKVVKVSIELNEKNVAT